jgi:hypothetical protein
VALSGLAAGPVSAGQPVEQSSEPDSVEQQLAERFAPILMLKQQEQECDTDGESYRPSSVDMVLDNPEIALRQLSRGDPVVTWAPDASDLFGLREGFFLDFPGSSLEPQCIYERDFRKYAGDQPATVYAHVVQQPDEPDLVFVQYWFYWYYNDWNNKHESDWEGITLKFEASSVDEALRSQPVAVGFSQHEGGERADWDDAKLEREGDRPVVYPSAGSHASYFGSALYLGRAASEGFGCDDTGGPSDRIDPQVVVLPDSVDDPDDPLAWLEYRGRWGERQSGAFNGPTGPAVKDRWLEPAPWFEELRGSSVVIPTGDSQAAIVIDVFCGTVEFGSQMLINFTVTPARVVVSLLLAAALISFLVNRTDWSPVAALPIRRRRRAGQIIRSAAATYSKAPLVFIMFGAVYVPVAFVVGVLVTLIEMVPLLGSLMALMGSGTGASLLLAALIGGAANIAAFVVVNSMVVDYLDHDERGFDAAVASARRAWEHRRGLAGGLLRSVVIVVALLATVVGAPWGFRQLVRYQFVAQSVMLDGADGRTALARSSELVKDRWFHTAIIIVVLNGLVALSALITGLLLLVIATGIPLWLFSALLSLVFALIVPFAAIAMALLYGDALVEHEGATQTEPIPVG